MKKRVFKPPIDAYMLHVASKEVVMLTLTIHVEYIACSNEEILLMGSCRSVEFTENLRIYIY